MRFAGLFVSINSDFASGNRGNVKKKRYLRGLEYNLEIAKPYEYTEKTDVQLALVALLAAVCSYYRQLSGPPSAEPHLRGVH